MRIIKTVKMRPLKFLVLLIVCAAARGQDLVRESIPQKWIEPVLPEDLPELKYPSWANDLDKARLEEFSGRYKKSLATLFTIHDADPVEVALIKSASLDALGRYDQAIAALSLDDPRIEIQRARILGDMGRANDGIALLKDFLKQHPDSIAGHYQIGALYELVGDLNSARDAYGWFVAEPQNFLAKWQKDQEKGFDNAADVTVIGRAIDRWASLTGSYQKLPQLHDALLNLFVKAYDVIDRDYWPAHVAAGEYYLSHDNTTEAVKELVAALAGNPNDIHTQELLGKIAVSQWNFDTADDQAEAIRKVNPNSIAADLLEARNLLQQRRPVDAMTPVQRVLEKQPNHLEALGLFAATYALQLKDDQTAQILKRVEKIDPDNSSAYFEVADQLGAMRQYPRAIAMYKIAIDRAPWWTSARNGLGLLYTQSGDEEDAKITLDAAHEMDPYNLRTTNYLRLLDQLQGFARKESAHFIVMYDAKIDPVIPEYFSDYLESVNDQVCGEYRTQPPVKTYIEVFPTHDAFSVRTTGSPWIGTVGASTGRVIALVSPRKGEATMGPFNWANVLRHEYTHTVTLAATDNRIPHWMTEGLAVYEEHTPLKWEWIPQLYDAVTKDQLFTMENLTWGFVRPKKPTDRSLAYAESFWICTFIEKNYGHEAILKMLAVFKAGGSEQDAFEKVLGKSLSEFQSEFFAWAHDQVATWGYDEKTSQRYDKLRANAEELVKARKYPEAAAAWEEIVAIRPVDELPHQRLAGLYLKNNQPQKAIEQLKILHSVELKDNNFAKAIAREYRKLNQLDDAKKYAMQAVYIDPYDLAAHQLLLDVATGDQATVDRENLVIEILEKQKQASESNATP
jgi:tetratricopeptide (TPR) repeat protein